MMRLRRNLIRHWSVCAESNELQKSTPSKIQNDARSNLSNEIVFYVDTLIAQRNLVSVTTNCLQIYDNPTTFFLKFNIDPSAPPVGSAPTGKRNARMRLGGSLDKKRREPRRGWL